MSTHQAEKMNLLVRFNKLQDELNSILEDAASIIRTRQNLVELLRNLVEGVTRLTERLETGDAVSLDHFWRFLQFCVNLQAEIVEQLTADWEVLLFEDMEAQEAES